MKFDRLAIIIGAMKAGTTSLFEYLASHPQLASSNDKEPGFFAIPDVWNRGVEWYESLWDFDPGRHLYALEGSTHYTKIPLYINTAARMASIQYDYRFIYLVRDPIERIESHLTMGIAGGWLPRDLPRVEAVPFIAIAYTRYARQLRAFTKFFPKDHILVLDFQDLRKNPQALVYQVCDFLKIDPFTPSQNKITQAFNASRDFRINPMWWAQLREIRILKMLKNHIFNSKVHGYLQKILWPKVGKKRRIHLSEPERKIVLRELADDIRELNQDWGIDTSHWQKPISKHHPEY